MTGLVLTAARRSELAALLDDEQRLRSEYPVVADYLDTAPRLPGTGDEAVDATFDLRLLHYMTGGESESGNPYWDIIAPFVSVKDGRRVVDGGRPRGCARLAYAQTILQAAYAYAIPSAETVRWIGEFAKGRRVLELGAGRGYWARLLDSAGIDVRAYDLEPPDSSSNASFPRVAGSVDVWHSVGNLAQFGDESLSDGVLLLCWPPGWGDPMASTALKKFEAGGGRRLVYIGEPRGGKTGDEPFFERLEEAWTPDGADERFVSWWNLNDSARGWVRRE